MYQVATARIEGEYILTFLNKWNESEYALRERVGELIKTIMGTAKKILTFDLRQEADVSKDLKENDFMVQTSYDVSLYSDSELDILRSLIEPTNFKISHHTEMRMNAKGITSEMLYDSIKNFEKVVGLRTTYNAKNRLEDITLTVRKQGAETDMIIVLSLGKRKIVTCYPVNKNRGDAMTGEGKYAMSNILSYMGY